MSGKVLHTVLMFDELATEKRIRWDPKTNYFLGVCREHAHKTSMEFINEGDMEELFRFIDAENIHYAGEVRMICFRFGSIWNFASGPLAGSDGSIFRQQLALSEYCAKIIAFTLAALFLCRVIARKRVA